MLIHCHAHAATEWLQSHVEPHAAHIGCLQCSPQRRHDLLLMRDLVNILRPAAGGKPDISIIRMQGLQLRTSMQACT